MTKPPIPVDPATQALAMSLVSGAIMHWYPLALGLPGAIYYCMLILHMRDKKKRRRRK